MLRQKDTTITRYLDNIKIMNMSTASQYERRLRSFSEFSLHKYGHDITLLTARLRSNELNVYEILAAYASYLLSTGTISTLTLKQWVVTAKNLLEFHDIDVIPKRFNLKVKLPRAIRRNKEALTKEFIADILNSIPDIRLKTYVLLLAATGMRPTEALSIRICDLSLDSDPPKLFVRGEYTKTKTDRYVFITGELQAQLNTYITYKYRTRRISYYSREANKIVSKHKTPELSKEDTLFSVHKSSSFVKTVHILMLYILYYSGQ